MIDEKKLIDEINRLKNELVASDQGTMYEQGRISALEDVLLFIKEPVDEDLKWASYHEAMKLLNDDRYLPTTPYSEKIPMLQNLYKTGAVWQKQQLMKDAIPATVLTNQYGNKYIQSWSGLVQYDKYENRAKIKIIIVKED